MSIIKSEIEMILKELNIVKENACASGCSVGLMSINLRCLELLIKGCYCFGTNQDLGNAMTLKTYCFIVPIRISKLICNVKF